MKTLSKNNAELKLVFPTIIVLFGTIVVFVVMHESILLKYFVTLGFFSLGFSWVFKRYKNSYNLFYNEQYLNLKNKNRVRNIDLKKIKRVKLTLSNMRIMGIQFYEYKIEFINESGIFESISFFVSYFNSNLWEFQDLIKIKSPKTIIEN